MELPNLARTARMLLDMARPSPLVSTEWLAEHADDASVIVLEISNVEHRALDEHIPGSRHVYWSDLCWNHSDREFPSPQEMADRLTALGVSGDSTIALVGDPVQFGTYAYWVLAMTGQESRTVLVDGGRLRWIKEGRPLGSGVALPAGHGLSAGDPDSAARIGRDELRRRLGEPDLLVLDARSPEEYAGERVSPSHFEVDHGAQRKGRIPGARHLYYQALLNDDESLLARDALEARFDALPIDDSETVVYCRLSHRATLMWFVLTRVLDHQNVRVYDGSWTEWGSIVGFPIER